MSKLYSIVYTVMLRREQHAIADSPEEARKRIEEDRGAVMSGNLIDMTIVIDQVEESPLQPPHLAQKEQESV
jgi:hypothetical protein